MQRRHLMLGALAAGVLPAAAQGASTETAPSSSVPDAAPLPHITDPGERRGDMLYRPLGSTGEKVSAIGFGGSHFAKPGISEDESIHLCQAAIDCGITFMDNSWDYNRARARSAWARRWPG
jgi:hypothetical protein